jgi:hypothetical protein
MIVTRNPGDDAQLKNELKESERLGRHQNNYLIVPRSDKSKVEMVLVDYKTNEKYGIIRHKFSITLSESIRKFMVQHGLKEGNYLFGKSSLSSFIGTMCRHVGIPKGDGAVNFIRHSKKTEIFNKNPNILNDPAEQLRVAAAFQHSPVTSLSYVRQVKLL